MHSEPCYPSKCCVDCLMYLANGETPNDLTEEETAEWLENFNRRTEGYEIILGKMYEYHECKSNFTVVTTAGEYETFADSAEDAREDHVFRSENSKVIAVIPHELQTEDDCECENEGFSWSSCDVCGSNLGGDRYAVTFWKIKENQDA